MTRHVPMTREFSKKMETFKKQNERCASCGVYFGSIKQEPCLDRDRFGMFKGVVCRNCYMAIGVAGDDLIRLYNLVSYFKRTRTTKGGKKVLEQQMRSSPTPPHPPQPPSTNCE